MPNVSVSDPGSAWKNGFFSVGSDRKSTRLNSSHLVISYAVFCLKKKISHHRPQPLAAELHGSRDAAPAAVRELQVGLLAPLGRADDRVLLPPPARGIADGIDPG